MTTILLLHLKLVYSAQSSPNISCPSKLLSRYIINGFMLFTLSEKGGGRTSNLNFLMGSVHFVDCWARIKDLNKQNMFWKEKQLTLLAFFLMEYQVQFTLIPHNSLPNQEWMGYPYFPIWNIGSFNRRFFFML